tara:strand:+ start:230 stop:481 length:252 start_codon:yes stop_codon:yes gene_type:complete
MGMKIQAITSTDGLNVAVGKTYYIEDTGSDITGKFEVTHLEVIAAGHSSASGVEVRAEIVVCNETEVCQYYDISLDDIIEDAN